MSKKVQNNFPQLGGGTVCTGCGKDPYLSSTGCLCFGKEHEWIQGEGSYGVCPEREIGDDGRDLTCPSCGKERRRASKDQRRVMRCGNCGEDTDTAVGIIKKLDEKGKKK
mmetsp:Transcript_32406/g.44513  ORF Transcript_32406/g.44513 Transcript_32406/m.44513 type:complete len:110 (+) Transcript_32406:87-416(+)